MRKPFAVLALSGAIGVAAVGLKAADSADTKAKPSPRPNVVVILADDQGWGDLSVHGNTNLQTPHIDSLARDGALFERFFVCPVCCADAGGVSHRPLPSARRRARRHHRRPNG